MCHVEYQRTPEVERARRNLSVFAVHQAHQRSKTLGFGWIAAPHNITRYEVLQAHFENGLRTGSRMPIDQRWSRDSVFCSARAHQAFRYWHDTNHVMLGRNFTLDSELWVGEAQLKALNAAGFDIDTTEFRMLQAESMGVPQFLFETGHMPYSQLDFAVRSLKFGIDKAIAIESGGLR